MRRSSFIFKENRVFIEEEDNSSGKVIIAEEELGGININGIGNSVDLLRLTFI